jgi:hypothetical protein
MLAACGQLLNEIDWHIVRNDTTLDGLRQKEADTLPTAITHINCPVVDVHPHELIGCIGGQTTGESHGIIQPFRTMLQAIDDARLENARQLRHAHWAKIAPDGIDTEGQWQSAGALMPPFTQVHNRMQT